MHLVDLNDTYVAISFAVLVVYRLCTQCLVHVQCLSLILPAPLGQYQYTNK